MKWGIIGLIVLLLLVFWKQIFNKISSGLAFMSAKSDQSRLLNETLNNPPGSVRYTFVKGIVDSVVKEVGKPFYQDTDEKYIVSQMNRLMNPEEVIYASNYFLQLKGTSFREFLKINLNADWRSGASFVGLLFNPNAAGSTYSDLNDVVKQNLI